MYIHDTQNALMQTIYTFLTKKWPDDVYYFLSDDGENIVELGAQRWQQFPPTLESFDYVVIPEATRNRLQPLIMGIADAPSNFKLHQHMTQQTHQLPGWWRFTNPLRALNIQLKAWLADVKYNTLLESDHTFFQNLIAKLNKQVRSLLVRIESLETQLHAVATDTSQPQDLVNDYDTLQADYQKLQQEMQQIQTHQHWLDEAETVLPDTAQILHDFAELVQDFEKAKVEIGKAHQEIYHLRAQLTAHHLEPQVNPSVLETTPPYLRVIEDESEIARINREYANLRLYRNRRLPADDTKPKTAAPRLS